MNRSIRKTVDNGKRFGRWLFRPNPGRFLAVWYTAWLGFGVKAFVVNWLICRQPIRIAWVPVTGSMETLYLLVELAVVGAIVWQAWRFERANWRPAFLYEWYSLIEIGLSLFNPGLWTYAVNRMWQQAPAVSDAATLLMYHVGFAAFYAFFHHGLPLLMLYQATSQRVSQTQPAVL